MGKLSLGIKAAIMLAAESTLLLFLGLILLQLGPKISAPLCLAVQAMIILGLSLLVTGVVNLAIFLVQLLKQP
jgi:hypothetical protein